MTQDIDFINEKNLTEIDKNYVQKSNILTEDCTECNIKKGKETILQEFYSNQCIFITGATGFLGKILIEKLLRCCPDISKIYILIRPKREKNITTRFNELFNNKIFDRLRKNNPEFINKIIGISGDCTLPSLGLCAHDKKLLIDQITIIFNVAATIRFDEELRLAAAINMQSIDGLNDICQNMKNLKSIVHVSTAYSNCFTNSIEEKFYDYSLKGEEFLNCLKSSSNDVVHKKYTKLINSWPNTYTLTKALAEDMIRSKLKNLPIGIFRPGIVISAAEEPLPGWIDNFNGPSGLSVAIIKGLMRVLHCNGNTIGNVIPVDLTVNAMIACAWDIATRVDRRNEKMLIYNFTSTVDAPITWSNFKHNIIKGANKYPLNTALWYKGTTIAKYKLIYWLYIFFLHWIPATVADFIVVSIGQKPRFIKMYQKLHKLNNILAFFCTNEWIFINNNVKSLWQRLDFQDKEIFRFSMENFNWNTYFDDYVKGLRIHLLKDDLKTLEASKMKQKRLYWLDQMLHILIYILGFWLLWSILPSIFK